MPKPCFVPRPPLTEAAAKALSENSVPLMPLEDACKGCTHEDSGNLEYPKRFEIDLESEMLGTVKAYGRELLSLPRQLESPAVELTSCLLADFRTDSSLDFEE